MRYWFKKQLFNFQTRHLTCQLDSEKYRDQSITMANYHFEQELGRSEATKGGHLISCVNQKTGKVIGILQFFTVEQLKDDPAFAEDYQSLDYIPKKLLPHTIITEFIHVDKKAKGNQYVSILLIKAFLEFFYQHHYYVSVGICEPVLYNFYRRLISFKTPTKIIKHPETGYYIVLVMTRKNYESSHRIQFLVDMVREEIGEKYCPMNEEFIEMADSIAHLESSGIRLLTEDEIAEFNIPLLEGIDLKTRKEFFKNSTVISSDNKDQIIREYDGGKGIVIIKQGTCHVANNGQVIATLQSGDLAGIFSYILDEPRTASVYSSSDNVEMIMLAKNCMNYISDQEQKILLWKNISKILCRIIIGK